MFPDAAPKPRRFSALQVLGIVLVAILLTMVATFFVVRAYLFPSEFTPVHLNAKEERVLNTKLRRIGWSDDSAASPRRESSTPLQPEPYSELGANREVNLSEKELNALLANNTDLARKLAIDLADNLASAKLLVPVDPDFPILGGKTLKVNAGVELSFANDRPVVVLKGVSVMGVPIPNAWLGNLKNVDLVREFGADEGFWKTFAAGVDYVRVEEGLLTLRLKE